MNSPGTAATEEGLQIGRRRIFIDALNLAYWCGNPPTLRLPITVLSHLLSAGQDAQLYFDASARYRLKDEAGFYERLIKHSQYVVEVPSGRTADGVMLRHATSSGGCILSRDRYRDYRRRYRKLIDDPTRLISGTVQNDRVLVPTLALDVPLMSSVDEAWSGLQSVLTAIEG